MAERLMRDVLAFLNAVFRLITHLGFAIAAPAAVVFTFVFAVEPELAASILILGFVTALAEGKLRAKGKGIPASQTVERPSDPTTPDNP